MARSKNKQKRVRHARDLRFKRRKERKQAAKTETRERR